MLLLFYDVFYLTDDNKRYFFFLVSPTHSLRLINNY